MAISEHTPTPQNEQAEWRPVVGYEGWYEVSSLGQVKRVRRTQGAMVGRVLPTHPNRAGYPRVTLCREGRCTKPCVHILVAAAFLGPCPEGLEVNHKDRDRTNPRAGNLEYLTHAENIRHSFLNGGHANDPRGTQKASAKLTEADVRAIRASGATLRALGRHYGVAHKTIASIKSGAKWAHVLATEDE